MKRIWFIVNKYPNFVEPNVDIFVQQLVWSVADLGYECSVIVPMPLNFNKQYKAFPEKTFERTDSGKKISLYYPKYYSLGQSGKTLQRVRVSITTKLFYHAVDRILKNTAEKPDILYSHFLCPAGVAMALLGKKYHIPHFMACGEARYWGEEKYGNKKLARIFDSMNGLIAVSKYTKDFCLDAGIIKEEIAEIFPNGYRPSRFFPRNQAEAREKFGFPKDAFIVGYCGSFDDRKGVLRLCQAVEELPDVYLACAGKGKLIPYGERLIYKEPVNHEDLSWFYSALDAFVLPTQFEGCCNAIVEAIACGCAIISSDRSFNYDICKEENSLLVDPDRVEEIKEAISKLQKDQELRERLKAGSLKMAKGLTLEERAKNIMHFIEERC